MRTTLNIEDDLMIRAKVRAAEERTTLTAIIEEALREKLIGPPQVRKRIVLPVWNDGGFPDVDIDWTSNEAVLDFIDSLGEEQAGGPS